MLRIELFNGPRIVTEDGMVDHFPTQHCAALLSLLALQPGVKRQRTELAELLWNDETDHALSGG